jgi:hypothetical protein
MQRAVASDKKARARAALAGKTDFVLDFGNAEPFYRKIFRRDCLKAATHTLRPGINRDYTKGARPASTP